MPVLVLGAPHQRKPSRDAVAAHLYPRALYGKVYCIESDYVFELDQEADKPRLASKLYEIAARYGAGIPRKRILVLSPSDLQRPDPLSHAREERESHQRERLERVERHLAKKQS